MTSPGIPLEVLNIIKTLNENNFKAYIVGGCVRDHILGKVPYDWDITTDALPAAVKTLFYKTVDTGLKHGTVTVVTDKNNYEVTTFRNDGEYIDNRKPESVEFTRSLTEDLSRRDFTMNAIAFHPQEGYIDPFNGIHDIHSKIIRAVGDPDKRFCEDALRMLRAVRFSAQLDFDLEGSTMRAIHNNKALVRKLSSERIREELNKLITSPNPVKLMLLRDLGLLEILLPEFDVCFDIPQNNPYHVYNAALHSLIAMESIEPDSILRWTMLLHDTGKALTRTTDENGIDHFYGHVDYSVKLSEEILKRLKFDNRTIDVVLRLIKNHDRNIEPNYKAVKKAALSIGFDIFESLLKVKEADKKAQNPIYFNEGMQVLTRIKELFEEIKSSSECMSLKELEISGSDLLELGLKPGREIGVLLNMLLVLVIENPELNQRDELLRIAEELVRGVGR